jgi:hypothetical protein
MVCLRNNLEIFLRTVTAVNIAKFAAQRDYDFFFAPSCTAIVA